MPESDLVKSICDRLMTELVEIDLIAIIPLPAQLN